MEISKLFMYSVSIIMSVVSSTPRCPFFKSDCSLEEQVLHQSTKENRKLKKKERREGEREKENTKGKTTTSYAATVGTSLTKQGHLSTEEEPRGRTPSPEIPPRLSNERRGFSSPTPMPGRTRGGWRLDHSQHC